MASLKAILGDKAFAELQLKVTDAVTQARDQGRAEGARASVAGALRSRTMRFGASLVVAGQVLAQLHAHLPEIQQYLTAETYGWVTSGIGIAIWVLRAVTDLPIWERGERS